MVIKFSSEHLDKEYPTRREVVAAGQEGLLSWLKDVKDRMSSNLSNMLSKNDCNTVISALGKADKEKFADMIDRTAGWPMYSKQQFETCIRAIPAATSFLTGQVTPLFKKMMSLSDKDVANFFRDREKGALATYNKKFLEMANKIKKNANDPVHVVAKCSANTWFSKSGATDHMTDIWGNKSKDKTYAQLGYTNPKDFELMFKSWVEWLEDSGVIGKFIKAMYTANDALCDFAADKLRVDNTGKLPDGIRELWHIFMYGCCEVFNHSDGWFFTVGLLENNFRAARLALQRLARVCDVEIND